MGEELGKIERPPVEQFEAGRRLYFVPLVFTAMQQQEALREKVNQYWDQVEEQLSNLERKLGAVNKVYHELIPIGGEAGIQSIEELNEGSYRITKRRLDVGADLQAFEDVELLAEFMDWGKCLAVGLQSHKAFTTIYDFYVQAQKRRSEHIAAQITGTLKDGETAIMLMAEGHHVQFPSDIQVFYIAPPALDEIKRWIREHQAAAEEKLDGDQV